jgi:hypothetical protein
MPAIRRPRLTLGVLMLWVAVVTVALVNLRIVAIDHRDDVRAIWDQIIGRPPAPYKLPNDWFKDRQP